jgi:hypothetical protein
MWHGKTTMQKKAILQAEFYTHRTIWNHAQTLRELTGIETQNPASLNLAALILLYFAFEGYMNYLLETAFPNIWNQERTFFSKSPYNGALGKLRYLREQLGIVSKKRDRPNHTVKRLTRLRHSIVHPRLEKQEKQVAFSDPRRLKDLESKLLCEANEKFLATAFEDVEQICDKLQAEALRQCKREIYGPKAFVGIIGLRGGKILNESAT